MTFVADVQQRVENWQLDSSAARANLLVNGGFRVSQRGTNFASVGYGGYCADRWQCFPNGSSTFTSVTQQGVTPYGPNILGLSGSFTFNAGDGSVVQHIKLADGGLNNLRGKALTFSMWVYSTGAQTRLYITSDGTGANQFFSGPGFLPASTWTRLTVTYPAIPNDATDISVGIYMQASAGWYITEAMLVTGTVPADYAPLTAAEDLARCQRYYEASSGNWLASGYCSSASAAEYVYRYIAPKGGTPTAVALLAGSNFSVRSGAAALTTGTSISFANTSAESTEMALSVASGLTLGQGALLYTGSGGAIRVEWNP